MLKLFLAIPLTFAAIDPMEVYYTAMVDLKSEMSKLKRTPATYCIEARADHFLYSVALNQAVGTPEHRTGFILAIVGMLKDNISDTNVIGNASLCQTLKTFGDWSAFGAKSLDAVSMFMSRELFLKNGIDLLDYEGICSSQAVQKIYKLIIGLIMKSNRWELFRFAFDKHDDEELGAFLSLLTAAVQKYDESQLANPDFKIRYYPLDSIAALVGNNRCNRESRMSYYERRNGFLDLSPLDIELQRVLLEFTFGRQYYIIGEAVDALRIDPRTPEKLLEDIREFQALVVKKLPLLATDFSHHEAFEKSIASWLREIVVIGYEDISEYEDLMSTLEGWIAYLRAVDDAPTEKVSIQLAFEYQKLLDLVKAIPTDHSGAATRIRIDLERKVLDFKPATDCSMAELIIAALATKTLQNLDSLVVLHRILILLDSMPEVDILGSIQNVESLIKEAVKYAAWDIDILGTMNAQFSLFILNLFKLGFTELKGNLESIDELLPVMAEINQHPQEELVYSFISICHEFNWADSLKMIGNFYRKSVGWLQAMSSNREVLPIFLPPEIVLMVSERIRGSAFSVRKAGYALFIEQVVMPIDVEFGTGMSTHPLYGTKWLPLAFFFASSFELSPDWDFHAEIIENIVDGWTMLMLQVSQTRQLTSGRYPVDMKADIKKLLGMMLSPEPGRYLPDLAFLRTIFTS